MIRDDADTDFKCSTTVSCFSLSYEKMREVEVKRSDLQTQRNNVKQVLYAPLYPLALDYIFHNNERTNKETYNL